MLALFIGPEAGNPGFRERVSRSLGLFFGAPAPGWYDSASGQGGLPLAAWQLPRVADFPSRNMRSRSPALRAWRPIQTQSGRTVLFHGALDNAAELARELGLPIDSRASVPLAGSGDLEYHNNSDFQARVYGAAVDRWGDSADARMIGHYCAVIADSGDNSARLARSPYYGPPLHYFVTEQAIGIASTLRTLEPMGLERRLNRRRLAESLFFIHGADEGYLEGSLRLHFGTIVKLSPGHREVIRFHDPLSVQRQPRASAAEYVREVDRLLREGIAKTFVSGRNPGLLLTGGLDSGNVASRLAERLGQDRKVHTFTYVPERGQDIAPIPHGLVDEGPAVLEFARRYPQYVPHLVNNAGISFDYRLEDMFLAMGTGTVNASIFFRYHGLFREAQKSGCDLLLSSDFGNFTFSAAGEWGFSEYLRSGRLIQLWKALKGYDRHPGSLFWKFCSRSIVPMLPTPLWRLAMRLRGTDESPGNMNYSALRKDTIDELELLTRAKQFGTLHERNWYATRSQHLQDNFARGDVEGMDMLQGFEQLYEISTRDATAYRPLIEFCAGLPTDMFLRDGKTRWLARELARGKMPEAQRLMQGYGVHESDWHARYTPKLDAMRRAVEEIRQDPLLNSLLDPEILHRDLDNWPEGQSFNTEAENAATMRLPRSIAMAKYVRFMTGSNAAQSE